MILKRGFASDNNSGVHPQILKALEETNTGHCIGYGDDPFTEQAIKKFKEYFGDNIDVYFVFTGTAANVLGLRGITQSYNSIICSDVSHLNVDECGAPENFSRCKLITIPTEDGKITPKQIEPFLTVFGNEHHSQPGVVSITQATELGTLYRLEEIKALADLAHENRMFLHMDGARISNAAAGLNLSLRAITKDAGVDVLSFGGTKNGMIVGEAIIFFNKELSLNFKYIRKQGMQLASKMRFISAQFNAYLSNDLWLLNARHANKMAKVLAEEISEIPPCEITQKVEANSVFLFIPEKFLKEIRKEYFFYVWDEKNSIVRLMTSFDTQEEDIKLFVDSLKRIVHLA